MGSFEGARESVYRWEGLPAFDPLTWPPTPKALLGSGEGTALQALIESQMLCSSSMGVPLKSFEPTTLGDNLPLHLSKHKSGCFVTCFHASHVSLFSCTHSIFPSAICSSTSDKSDLSLNQNGEEGSKERGRRYTAVTLHETPVSQPAPVDYCNPDFLLTLLSVSFPTSSKASC